jgi:hypothetical protein
MLPFNEKYFNLLKTHFLCHLNVNFCDDPWMITTFIIPYDELWNAINHYMTNIHFKTLKQKCYTIITTNTYK